MRKKIVTIVALFIAMFITGCSSSNNFAKSVSPVTVQEEWKRSSITVWEGTKIYRIGNIEFGYFGKENGAAYKVDPGITTIQVWYYANRKGFSGMFHQTNLVNLKADLKPNGHYQIQGDYGESYIKFKLVDIETKKVVTQSKQIPIILKRSPIPVLPMTVPIFIPI